MWGAVLTPTEEKQPFLAGLFQVKNCFQNPEMMARLSSASCRVVGRAGLSGRAARRPRGPRGPQTHLIAGHACQGQASGPDYRDIFRNN